MTDPSEIYIIPDETPTEFLDMPTDSDLDGYWWETETLICIPLIESRRKGSFSKWLTELEKKGKAIFIPTIVNAKLYGRLIGRGYVLAGCEDKYFGFVQGLAYCPSKGQGK